MVMKSMGQVQDLRAVATQPVEFEALYREHLPFVRQYLARRVEDPFLVADLTADVFLSVIRAATTYRRELGPPRAWLTGIARNIVADHRRSRAREDATARRQQGRRLLDEDSTDRIVELVAVDGLAVGEAAALLGISPGAARVRYHRARRLLQHTPTVQLNEVTP